MKNSFLKCLLTGFITSTLFMTTIPSFAVLSTSIQKKLAKLEASSGGRIGLYVIDTANDKYLEHRADERFPMGCTSKVIGVAAVLHKSMSDSALLSQKINYTKDDLRAWSPVTEKYLLSGMTVEELCDASIRYSDNTAMNLLVKKIGGLEQMNLFAHSIGNTTFRQDHDWPKEAYSGGKNNLKDSATPKDMANSLQKLIFTDVLEKSKKEMLLSWLKANTTGAFRIRAGVPKGWMVADKTGSGAYGTTNDLGIIWPPHCAPIIMAIYYTNDDKNAVKKEDLVASVTRLLIDELSKNNQCIRI